MRKVIYLTLVVVLLTLSLGCSNINVFSKSGNATVKIIRNTPLTTEWQMYQLEVTLTSGGKMPIILELANGDKVDGYYYVESGDANVGFQITANSKLYESSLTSLQGETPVSDRFSFTATQAQGIAYTLEFRNSNDVTAKTQTTIFLEIIYPGSSPVWTPLK
jgi:hypothetical protein